MSQQAIMKQCFLIVADTCQAASMPGEARKLRQAKIEPSNVYSCATRALEAVDLTVRLRFGAVRMNRNSVAARAVEAMATLRSVLTHVLASQVVDEQWLSTLQLRLQLLRHQAWTLTNSHPTPKTS